MESSKTLRRFCDLIGLRYTDLDRGCCRTELTITDAHLNPYGTLHGAVVYALADTGMGGALSTLLGEKESCATLEIKISYLDSVRTGTLLCETKVVQRGKGIAFLESEVFNQEHRLLAKASGTFRIFKPREGKVVDPYQDSQPPFPSEKA